MTLSNDAVESALNAGFVCAHRNILGEPYAGMSGAHEIDDPAYYTTNGAGPHNMQLFVLDADGTVLTCLPGFWSPEDLLCELAFAQGLDAIWRDAALTRAEKDARFRAAHLAHVQAHSDGMRQRSKLQGFDAKHEKELADSDYRYHDGDFHPAPIATNGKKAKAGPELKTCDQVMHERMAERPFVAYAAFDTGAFSQYGKISYDKKKFDGSEPWPQEQASILKDVKRKRKQTDAATASR